MNLQPHQRQFAHTYAGPAYPQQPAQQQQNFTGPKAPDPCYNCGSLQHVAQHCREARRAVPAGSLSQTPRPQRGSFKKNNSKPIVTRFAPPPNYANGPHPQQPPFPQMGPFQPHQQPPHQQPPHQQPHQQPHQKPHHQHHQHQQHQQPPRQHPQQQSQQQWQQQPQGYGPHAQAWQQQPYAAPTAAPSQSPTYSHHQQQAPQYGRGQKAQPSYPQQQHPYGYPPKPNWTVPAQPLVHPQPTHPQYSSVSQSHPQPPHTQQQNYQQYPQQQLVQSPYTPVTPQGFPHVPSTQNYHGAHAPQPQQFSQQSTGSNNVPTPQQPPPPKPPPCFPNAEKNANLTAKSGVIIWRPAQPTDIPLAPTFVETDEQRASKQAAGAHIGSPKDSHKKKRFSKYFDGKGNRIGRDLTAYEAGSEMMKDPAFTSVRTGESMVAQPLDFVLPDDPEEEDSEVMVVEETAESGDGLELEGNDVDVDGTSDGTEAGDYRALNSQKGPKKRKTKMDVTTGDVERQKSESVLSETKKSWNRQSGASVQAGHNATIGRREGMNNGIRGRNNHGGNLGKRKSRSPLDNSRPQKHRVRDATLTISTSSIPPVHHGLPQLPPSHHPLPPKPVVAPPPPQHFHHGNNRPQNTLNRPQNSGNRRNQNHKQRNHPYARRSASPVRHMLVDNQRRERDYGQGKGRGRQQQQQQQTPSIGQ